MFRRTVLPPSSARHFNVRDVRLTDHVTLDYNNKIFMAAVFFDIGTNLKLHGTLTSYINSQNFIFGEHTLISSFLSNRKFIVRLKANVHAPRNKSRVPQITVLAPTLPPQTPGIHLALFSDDTCLYVFKIHIRYFPYKRLKLGGVQAYDHTND